MYALLDGSGGIAEFPVNLKTKFPSISWPRDMTNATLPENVVRVHVPARPKGKFADVVMGPLSLEQEQWTASWNVLPWPLERTRKALSAAIAAKRFEVESRGIVLAGGVHIDTSIDSQNRITGAFTYCTSYEVASVNFKCPDGTFTTLTLEQISAMAGAVGQHVQACFNAEKEHIEAINALATHSELAAYDIDAGWPQ